jgi:hypothetical protein
LFKKSPRVSSVAFLTTLIFCFFLNVSLLATLKQNNIIYDLQKAVEDHSVFYGCSFTLFDPDLPEHKEYYENLKSRNARTNPLSERLFNELEPRQLNYFYQFKERIYVTQQFSSLKKDEADYCLLYTKQFYNKTNPKNIIKNEKYYDESLLKCNKNYLIFCKKTDKLESLINAEFLKYYALGNPYNSCNVIYDHGLVQFANGNIENAVSLADEFLKLASNENKDLTSFSSEQLLNLGVTYNEAMEYSKAIDFLNTSIEKDPTNKEAYFQRAISYLEVGLFENAVKNFMLSDKEKNHVPIRSKAPDEFRDAFLLGLIEGSKGAVIDFIPSLFSFAYTTVLHPIDSLIDFADASHELMHVTKDYLNEVNWSQIEDPEGLAHALVEPGIKKLYENMKHLSPNEQGHLLGSTIGSFGIELVAGVGLVKGLAMQQGLQMRVKQFETQEGFMN